jgi:ribonuclease T1
MLRFLCHGWRFSCVVFLSVLWLPAGAQADSYRAAQSAHVSLPIVSIAEIPPEARDTLRTIKQGGPFAYSRDGVVFGNYERILPKQSRGYYHEYTVKTPGAHNRGARRIICGPLPECYYTADHYKTFKRIRE